MTAHLPLIRLRNVARHYPTPDGMFAALNNINLDIHQGEFVAVVGKSGSGKSTLMNVITGIDLPTSGEIHVGEFAIHRARQFDLSAWRGKQIGVVFQFFQLLPTLTVLENVMLPMDFCHIWHSCERKPRAMALLDEAGIATQWNKLPADLSGGQQQCAAIARALANDPPILVADEPTGNLDSETAEQVMQLFAAQVCKGKTVILVTHEREFSHYFTRVVTLTDGTLNSSGQSQQLGARPLTGNEVVQHG